MAHHDHHQPGGCLHRHPQMHAFMPGDDAGLIIEAGIDLRKLPQGPHHRQGDERQQRQAPSLRLMPFIEPGAQRQQRRHVHFLHVTEMRDAAHGLLHPLGNAPAQARHRHLLRAGATSTGTLRPGRRPGSGHLVPALRRHHLGRGCRDPGHPAPASAHRRRRRTGWRLPRRPGPLPSLHEPGIQILVQDTPPRAGAGHLVQRHPQPPGPMTHGGSRQHMPGRLVDNPRLTPDGPCPGRKRRGRGRSARHRSACIPRRHQRLRHLRVGNRRPGSEAAVIGPRRHVPAGLALRTRRRDRIRPPLIAGGAGAALRQPDPDQRAAHRQPLSGLTVQRQHPAADR